MYDVGFVCGDSGNKWSVVSTEASWPHVPLHDPDRWVRIGRCGSGYYVLRGFVFVSRCGWFCFLFVEMLFPFELLVELVWTIVVLRVCVVCRCLCGLCCRWCMGRSRKFPLGICY